MKKSVLVTAVSGSGKSTVCKELAKLGYTTYDIEDTPGLFSLLDEKTRKPMIKHNNGDLELVKQGDWVCDKDKLQELINSESADLTFYCGAAGNIQEIRGLFDVVIVLQVSDKTTLKRLGTRIPGEFGHTAEVRDWVLSWKHDVEKEWLEAGGIPVSAEDSPEEVARRIIQAI
jgi:dephospho-CoA kinase